MYVGRIESVSDAGPDEFSLLRRDHIEVSLDAYLLFFPQVVGREDGRIYRAVVAVPLPRPLAAVAAAREVAVVEKDAEDARADVREVAPYVLTHRLLTRGNGASPEEAVREALDA